MSLFLTLECSTAKGSLALLESNGQQLNCLYFDKWLSSFNGKRVENSHSDKLPKEIDHALKAVGKELSDLTFLAVGNGPGRWTGIRTAVTAARSLAFGLKIPVYPVNSLRVCAEAVLSPSSGPVFVAGNGFKNSVYFAKFNPDDLEGELQLLSFAEWLKQMEASPSLKGKKSICLSDLEDFYPLPPSLKTKFSFKKLSPDALYLAQIVFKQKEKRESQSWRELKAVYLRSPLE